MDGLVDLRMGRAHAVFDHCGGLGDDLSLVKLVGLASSLLHYYRLRVALLL